MRKKLIKILIVILLLLSFVGCNSSKNKEDHTGEKYTIAYIYENEVLNINPSEYISGEEIVLPIPSIKGFDGWYESRDFTGEEIKQLDKDEYGTKIFYAKVDESKITYNISYYDGDKLLNLSPAIYSKGSSITLPNPGEKENYEFKGWYTESTFENQVFDIKNTDTEDKVFYAKYEKTTFTIKYYNGSTELELNPSSYKLGTSVTLPTLDSSEGLEFKGWYTESSFINKIEEITEKSNKDYTLYARFSTDAKYVVDTALTFKDAIKTVNRGEGLTIAMPSTGNVKALIVPVDFTDYPADEDLDDLLTKAFFGTSEETGWESLSSYYEKSSYGKLKISGEITDVYHTGQKSSYYTKKDETKAVNEIIQGALKSIDSKIDFSEFDSNSDGNVDAIYFVYTAPVDYDGYTSDLWWAYCDQYSYSTETYDGKYINYYMFAGTDFLSESNDYNQSIIVNAETLIHESGHLLGLDDYYDYDTSDNRNKGGIGGGDMMDYNVGDHNAYSKAVLGWITPQLINVKDSNTDYEIVLRSFGSTGDALIIAKKDITSYYDEYFIIDYYTADGLNDMAKGYNGLFSNSGVRIYHITATLTTDIIDCMWDMTKYNNASAKYKLIKLIEADGKNDIDKEKESSNSDLFYANDTYSNFKWNDGTSLNITMKVVSLENNQASIEIQKNK